MELKSLLRDSAHKPQKLLNSLTPKLLRQKNLSLEKETQQFKMEER